MASSSSSVELLCPSAPHDWAGAQIIGTVAGTLSAPLVSYLPEPRGFEPAELAALTAPIDPTEDVRVAAPCAGERCGHYADDRCTLVERTVELLPTTVARAPSCAIRRSCRWFGEQGLAACLRCPAVVTSLPTVDPLLRKVTALPATADSTPDYRAQIRVRWAGKLPGCAILSCIRRLA